MRIDADELDDLDHAILDYLTEQPDDGGGWGIATPAVVHDELIERGFDDVPTRQTVQSRLSDLRFAGCLENLQGHGVYRLVNDPRKQG